ncbi:MAG: tetratricopeptide repeat protein [Acidobacteria bacterium]|nr:tetratricopeptide repeat protein [Acidobacteriota bacterium]
MKRTAFERVPRAGWSTFALRVSVAAALLGTADVRASCAMQERARTAADAAQRLPARVPLDALPAAARADLSRAYARAQRLPRDASAAGEVAMLLHAHDQFEPARQWYEYARRLESASIDWTYGAGLTGILAGRHREAVAALRDAVRLDTHAVPARLRYRAAIELFDRYGAAHYALALALRNLGDPAGAAAALGRYEQHRMDTPPLPDPLLDAVDARGRGAGRHLAAGISLANTGRTDEAIREHEKAVAVDPGLAQAHVHLIALYAGKGNIVAAEKHYRAVLGLNSHLADAHYNYGVLLMNANRMTEAGGAFRQAVDANPLHAPARNNLGQVLEYEQRVTEAANEYRLAVEADPNFRLARFNLGRMLVALGRPTEAIDQLLRTLEPADASTPTYMYGLAAAYVRAGDRDAALRYAQEAQRQATQLGQHALAATIARDLEKLKR